MEIRWSNCVRKEEVLSRGGEEYTTSNKKNEGQLDWSHLVYELAAKTHY